MSAQPFYYVPEVKKKISDALTEDSNYIYYGRIGYFSLLAKSVV